MKSKMIQKILRGIFNLLGVSLGLMIGAVLAVIDGEYHLLEPIGVQPAELFWATGICSAVFFVIYYGVCKASS